MSDWAIPQQAKLKYTQLFNLHDRSRSGFLSGLQCRDILLQSGLPRNILAEIWNLSDIDGDGQLTREEFILAMHLTNHVRSGQTLPAELPADLVPPSYRRTRSISATSVNSAASSTASSGAAPPAASTNEGDQFSIKSSDLSSASSVLNSNTFEDKRRENFERGRAELERRRLQIIEQQASVLSEQLSVCKKQVAEAKSKVDAMRSDRDTKAGLITSLEAQLQTVRDRRTYLNHEELQLAAIAKDLNLVNPENPSDLDQQAAKLKQESINQLKVELASTLKENEEKSKELASVNSRLEEMKNELKSASEEASKAHEIYKEKIAAAKIKKQQLLEENKTKGGVDLDSVWDSAPTTFASKSDVDFQSSARLAEPVSSAFDANDVDPWAATTAAHPAKSPDEPFSFSQRNQTNSTATNNNDYNFEPARDYGALTDLAGGSKAIEQPAIVGAATSSGFSDSDAFGVIPDRTSLSETAIRYKALYAFEARNPDELTINVGDIITGSGQVCEPGWLSGKLNGRTGLFPEAYVEPIARELNDKSDALFGATTSAITTASIQPIPSTAAATEPTASSANSSTAAATSTTNAKYKVVYAFNAVNQDELTINPGDIISGVGGPCEPGWLMGELDGKRGLFPEAYVERIAEEVVQAGQAAEQPTGILRRGSSSGSLRSKKSRSKKAEVATVIANYRALGQEQLNLEKGQLVLIRRKMDSGWWEGELQIKDDDDKRQAAIVNGPQLNGDRRRQRRPQRQKAELDYLIDELVASELDFVNDLRLCQSAYIIPLSSSFDVSHIFPNWNQLVQSHEAQLTKLAANTCSNKRARNKSDYYSFVFETFLNLLGSVVDVYVELCSRQTESTRQLEAKLASDIRFKQLVNESQRKLKKLIEQQISNSSEQRGLVAPKGQPVELAPPQLDKQNEGQLSRALRNSNLPLTSFLLKPMQRITKYSLLFGRMQQAIERTEAFDNLSPAQLNHLQGQLERLKFASERLCSQVNEACRLKEDDESNKRKLRWCQNHIKQHLSRSPDRPSSSSFLSELSGSGGIETSLSSSSSTSMSFSSPTTVAASLPVQTNCDELICFESLTNYLGPRKLIKAASLIKLKSGKELVGFLFNDLLLLTLPKGGLSLRVADLFESEKGKQAYYKLHRRPIMLHNVFVQHEPQTLPSCSFSPQTLNEDSCQASDQLASDSKTTVSFVDSQTGALYVFGAINSREQVGWTKALTSWSLDARAAHTLLVDQVAAKRLAIEECSARLFLTVVEFNVAAACGQSNPFEAPLASGPCEDFNSSWERRRRLSQASQLKPNSARVCLKLQMKRCTREGACLLLDASAKPANRAEVVTTSDVYKTRPFCLPADASNQPVEGLAEQQVAAVTSIKFDGECTQFLVAKKEDSSQEQVDFLHVDLVEECKFRPTKLLASKRINIDRLLGGGAGDQTRRQARALPPLNRPVEMVFKLKPPTSGPSGRVSTTTSATRRNAASSPAALDERMARTTKFSVRLTLHVQVFCDNTV